MQNGKQPIRLPNGLLYPRVEVEQRIRSGDKIGSLIIFVQRKRTYQGGRLNREGQKRAFTVDHKSSVS